MGAYPHGEGFDEIVEAEPALGDRLRTGVQRHASCRAGRSKDFEELCALTLPLFIVSPVGFCSYGVRTYVMM